MCAIALLMMYVSLCMNERKRQESDKTWRHSWVSFSRFCMTSCKTRIKKCTVNLLQNNFARFHHQSPSTVHFHGGGGILFRSTSAVCAFRAQNRKKRENMMSVIKLQFVPINAEFPYIQLIHRKNREKRQLD